MTETEIPSDADGLLGLAESITILCAVERCFFSEVVLLQYFITTVHIEQRVVLSFPGFEKYSHTALGAMFEVDILSPYWGLNTGDLGFCPQNPKLFTTNKITRHSRNELISQFKNLLFNYLKSKITVHRTMSLNETTNSDTRRADHQGKSSRCCLYCLFKTERF